MPKPFIRILIVAAVCVLGLIGLVVRESMARSSGTEIVLPIEAVDPRDLLSGHYVIVRPTEAIPPDQICPSMEGDWEWVSLAPNGETVGDARVYSFAAAAPTRGEANLVAGNVVVHGDVMCSSPIPPDGEFTGAPGRLIYNLGFDRFYINQAQAERIDLIMREQRPGEEARVYVIASVGNDGRARLKGLFVDGERLDLDLS
jgi:hypothetical protein